jgi:regulator of sirC expression with transglutaminase-like and TPR domain
LGARLRDEGPGLAPELAARINAMVVDAALLPDTNRPAGGWAGVQTQLLAELSLDPEAGKAALRDKARQLEIQASILRDMADQVHRESVRHELAGVLNGPQSGVDLFHAALLVARLDNFDLNIEGYRDQLNEMAQEISASLAADASPLERRGALIRYLFEDNGFHGSRHDYYHRANSQIDRVLDDREGLPITLSVLFIELAARIGLEGVEGVPLPGHFVVRHATGDDGGVLLDVFEGGKTLSREDVETLVVNHSGTRLREEHLVAASPKDIILRMLRNLQGVAEREDTPDRELIYLDALLALSPDSAPDRYVRAGKRLRVRDVAGAREDLKWLLDHQPPGVNLEALAELYQSLGVGRGAGGFSR